MKPLEKDIKKTSELNKEIAVKRIKKFEQEKLVSNLQNQKESENNLAVLMKQSEDPLGIFVDATYSPEAVEKKRAIENHIQKVVQDLKQEISESNKKIQAKTNDIENISEIEKDAIEKRGGDISTLEDKLKPEFNLLKLIRENVGTKFAKIAGTISMITAFNLTNAQQGKLASNNVEKKSSQEIHTLLSFNEAIEDPDYFFEHANDYVDVVGEEKVVNEIINLIQKNPKSFIKNAYRFVNLSSANFDLAKTITGAVNMYEAYGVKEKNGYVVTKMDITNTPYIFALHINEFKKIPGLDLNDIVLKVFRDDKEVVLEHIQDFRDIKGFDAAKFVLEAGAEYSKSFLDNIKEIKKIPNLDVSIILNQIAKTYPGNLLMHADPETLKELMDVAGFNLQQLLFQEPVIAYVSGAVENLYKVDVSKTPELDSFYNLIKNGFDDEHKNEKLVTLINDVVRHGLSVEDAKKIADDPALLFKSLVKIKSEQGHLGSRAVEDALVYTALQEVENINSLHEETEKVRFKSVEEYSPEEFYTLMTYGEDEIFTSSFNGLFSRMMLAMSKEGLSGDKLLERMNGENSRVFAKECAGFNRFNEFLETMEDSAQESLVVDLVQGIAKSEDFLIEGATMVDIMKSLQHNKKIYSKIEEQIKLNIAQATDPERQIAYIVLGGVASTYNKDTAIWPSKFRETLQLPMFDLERLRTSELFNEKGVNVQEYFFYDDNDGKASFASFLAQYENRPGWEVRKNVDYLEIISTKPGKKIQIFANYPESDQTGAEKVQEILQKQQLIPTVIVHRGHSYHADATISDIQPTAKIVSLGSCGGYNNVAKVLKKSPDAQILSTKGTGTMLINDPLLKMLNEQILSGKEIIWADFWQKLENRVGKDSRFKDYVSPDKNAGALFVKMYYDLTDKIESMITTQDQK